VLRGKSKWLFLPLGILSLAWYLIRVISKPSRSAYPCQQVAGPVALGFIGSVIGWVIASLSGIIGGAFSWLSAGMFFRTMWRNLSQRRFSVAALFFFAGIVATIGLVTFLHVDSNASAIAAPTLTAPANTAIGVAPMCTLSWSTVSGAATYNVQIATSNTFAAPIARTDSILTAGSWSLPSILALQANMLYYWRVRSKDTAAGAWSSVRSFTTVAGTGMWTTMTEQPNQPVGVAKGICPGRVAWSRDSTASTFNGTGNWWDSAYNNQAAVDRMLANVVEWTVGKTTVASAWDTLFRNFNLRKHGANTTYQQGEKIVVKINLNNSGNGEIDASPQLCRSLLRQLVDSVGVAQANICIYDAARTAGPTGGIKNVYSICGKEFPNVNYNNHGAAVDSVLAYATPAITDSFYFQISQIVKNANYYINMPLIKRHTEPSTNWNTNFGNAAVSMCFKSHVGDLVTPWQGQDGQFHTFMQDWRNNGPCYNVFVDMESNQYLGGNTILYILDGLYTGNRYDSKVQKWVMFGNKYPCMVLASQDPVALESVGVDFLRAEWIDYSDTNFALVSNADNHLKEAAQIGNPPSGTQYVNRSLGSLGVHEHWNNSTNKQYSRNLGTGTGIELVSSMPPVVSVQPHNGVQAPNTSVRFMQDRQGLRVYVPSECRGDRINVVNIQGKQVVSLNISQNTRWYSISGKSLAPGEYGVTVIGDRHVIIAETSIHFR
jgi:uncharacterized protein (DUF362 family)